MPAQCLTCLQ